MREEKTCHRYTHTHTSGGLLHAGLGHNVVFQDTNFTDVNVSELAANCVGGKTHTRTSCHGERRCGRGGAGVCKLCVCVCARAEQLDVSTCVLFCYCRTRERRREREREREKERERERALLQSFNL